MQTANINQLNDYGKELFAKAKHESVFIKIQGDEFSDAIADYHFFEYLKKLYSPTPTHPQSLYDACMPHQAVGDMDFDSIRKNQPFKIVSPLEFT